MGILGSIISDALSSGIKKGLGNAVSKAVEDIVKPSVENYAKQQAEKIDAASESLEQSTTELRKATAEAAAESGAQEPANDPLAGLEAALGGLAKHAENYAQQMSKTMKMCPKCEELCPADQEYCPKCGAKLPEHTVAHSYTCPQCGEVNLPGTKYCTKCGTVLPIVEEQQRQEAESDAAVREEMKQRLPQYPGWTVGGSGLELEENGESDGHPVLLLRLNGTEELLEKYVALLLDNGFDYICGDRSATIVYKMVDGECYCFGFTEAYDDGTLSVSYAVMNEYSPKPKEPQRKDVDVADIAKGLFKKLF